MWSRKAGVLMGEAVVVLLPDVAGQHQVQAGDALAPGQLAADLEPLRMLGDHRVDHADEALVAGEEAVAAGQQVAFEPAFAHMLRKHTVHDAAVGGQELVAGTVALFQSRLVASKHLYRRLDIVSSGPKTRKFLASALELEHVADVAADLDHVLLLDAAGERDVNGIVLEVGGAQVAQQLAAVGVRVGRQAAVAGSGPAPAARGSACRFRQTALRGG